jgi:predicted ester cyclase
MLIEINKAIVRRMYEEVFNRRNLALADELAAPESITHEDISHEAPPGMAASGPDALRQVVQLLTVAFPDHHTTIEDLIAEGDKVAVRTTFSGTHQGAYLGIAPTGRPCTQQQIHIVRITDGKVTEHWAIRDDLGMMRQLGVISGPGHERNDTV